MQGDDGPARSSVDLGFGKAIKTRKTERMPRSRRGVQSAPERTCRSVASEHADKIEQRKVTKTAHFFIKLWALRKDVELAEFRKSKFAKKYNFLEGTRYNRTTI